MWINRILIICLIFGQRPVSAQELPPVDHFSPKVYSGGSQNWSIAQGPDQRIYLANNNGLLVFNGSMWKLYPSPNQTIMRSVAVIDGRIYTGSYMEFGYWEWDKLGQLTYTSISKNITDRLIEDEEFWSILKIGKQIAFQSLKQIYLYDLEKKAFETIPSDGALIRMFELAGELYFQQENEGLLKFSNETIEPVLSHPVVRQDEIIQIIRKENNTLLITRNSGIFNWTDDGLNKIKTGGIDVDQLTLYSAIQLKNQSIALGSISNGLFFLDKDLTLNQSIDQNSGLGNNTVLSLYEDAESNLWAGLDNGITCINSNSAIKVFSDKSGRLGTVYASEKVGNRLYLGTNQGLFVKNTDTQTPFEFIEGTDGQVWDLNLINGTLFCSHHKGTFTIREEKAELIPGTRGSWQIMLLDKKKQLYLQGSYDGLYVIQKLAGKWKVRNRIDGFNNSARHVEFLENQVVVNHEYKGIFILTVDYNFQKVLNTKSRQDLLGANSGLARYKDKILYAFSGGIYSFNTDSQSFVRSEHLSSLIDPQDYVSGNLILTKDETGFWLFKKGGVSLIRQDVAGSLSVQNIPLTLGIRSDMEEYENILQLDSSSYLMGRADGYTQINLDVFEIPDFKVNLTQMRVARTSEPLLPVSPNQRSFDSQENNFRFDFYAPVYKNLFQPLFRTKLEGIYNEWSDWSSTPYAAYENLPAGKYTFKVQAKVGEQLSENTYDHQLTITKPWYLTNLVIFLYFIGFVTLSFLMHRTYRGYYKRQQAELIKKNLQQLEFERMKNEQEIIKLKNVQLETSYEAKSKELATSLMNIVNKNELLNQIKGQLLQLKDQEGLSSVIKTIDKNLNQKKNWEMFKEAFDNADSEFFKNLQEKHPKLSPNDLKLCAYLRLNLSSKEIAPLINISPRSVEIKRYRLRKKLNLDGNENLVNYIMSI